jgi:indoleacetamide hydrolase
LKTYAGREFNRREFLRGSAALASAAAVASLAPMLAHAANSNLTDLTATQAVAAMKQGDITAEAYANALLQRCAALKDLNAFLALDADSVLAAARAADQRRASGTPLGLMHGLPVAMKDSINTKELPTTAGTPALKNFRPKADAPVAAALFNQGAILLGKTNLHELSLGWTSNNLAFGAVHNPYDRTRIPGGSSGGTAVAVAARMVSSGLAEDTTGSIRVPASLCGIAALRPTTGRYPVQGICPITPVFDTAGPHARSIADLALYDHVITGEAPLAPAGSLEGVRLGISPAYFLNGLDAEVERAFNAALRRLRAAGAALIYADVPNLPELANAATWPILQHEAIPSLEAYLKDHQAGVNVQQVIAASSPDIQWVIDNYFRDGGKLKVPQDVYKAALSTYRPALQQAFSQHFERHGIAALVHPPTLRTASKIGEDVEVEINGQKVPLLVAYSQNIMPASGAGLPGLVLPSGLTASGLPIGIEFDGPAGKDRDLLALGYALEKALGSIPMPAL